MEDFLKNIMENSFSVVVAAFLLIRMERRLDDLTAALARLEAALLAVGRSDRGD